MTPRERTLAVVARERPDRLPRELKLTPAADGSLPAAAPARAIRPSTFSWKSATSSSPRRPQLPDFSQYYPEGVPRLWNPAGWEVGEWGVGVKDGSMHHFVHIEHPMRRLSKLEELERYPFPDLTPPRAAPAPRGPGARACTTAACSSSASWNGRFSRSPGTCGGWRSCSTTSPSTRRLPNTCSTGSPRFAVFRPGVTPRRAWTC